MQIQVAVNQRDALIQKLRLLVPSEQLESVIEDVKHACDLSFEAGKTLWAEREAFLKREADKLSK